jgi:DNA-binding NtrC family response regulator
MKQKLPLPETASQIKAVVIIEDEGDITSSLLQVVGQETPYHMLIVSSSLRAFETLQHVKPSLFLLDLSLHTMTGITLYDQFHAISELANIPTIIVSDSLTQHQQEIEERHLIGISKPLDVDELLETIENLLV